MELIVTIAGPIIGFVVTLAAHVIAHDAYASMPRYARRLIELAAKKLPANERERYLEEWLADVSERPSVLSKFQHAVECYICAKKVAVICSQRRQTLINGPSSSSVSKLDIHDATGVFLLATLSLVKQKEKVGNADFDAVKKAVESIVGPVDMNEMREVVDMIADVSAGSQNQERTFNVRTKTDAKQFQKQIAEVYKMIGIEDGVEFTDDPE
jgi:hypothetical protein